MRLAYAAVLASVLVLICSAAPVMGAEQGSSYSGTRSLLLEAAACGPGDQARALFDKNALAGAVEWGESASRALEGKGGYRFDWDDGGIRLVRKTVAPKAEAGESCIQGVAEVPYGLVPLQGEGNPALMVRPDAPLMVGLATDKGTYGADESIQVGFKGNKDFYGRLFFVSANGALIQLVPSLAKSAPLFKAGVQYDFPSEDDGVELKVTKPYGKGTMVLFASTCPMADFPLKQAGGGLGMYLGTLEQLGLAARAPAHADTGAPCEFFQAVWRFNTGPALPITPRGVRKKPLSPIDMTGAAGRSASPEAKGLK